MSDPATILRAGQVDGMERGEVLFEWIDGRAGLVTDRVTYRGKAGAILAYTNPPVHQVGNPGLDAYLTALDKVAEHGDELSFLVLTGPCDPAHAGGDIRESLTRLDDTIARREELMASGGTAAQIWDLYSWGDARLDKGLKLYKAMRGLSGQMTTVAVCGGGTRFGGSAEICLLADVLIGDSRSGMSFSEAQIGLIPGWGGVGRAVTKAGFANARAATYTAGINRAGALLSMGIYDEIVEIGWPLPRMERTGDKDADKARFKQAMADNQANTAPLLLKAALMAGMDKPHRGGATVQDATLDRAEIDRRSNPETYEGLWGTPLREVKDRIKELGKPLAPQSVEALDELFARFEAATGWDEEAFILAEKDADATLYRDPRFRAGIVATLEQRVADFRRP